MSRASTYMSPGKRAEDMERELADEDLSYEMHRSQTREHGSPELVDSEFSAMRERERTLDDNDMAPLTRNAQRTPTVTFGGVTHQPRGYAEVGQHDADYEDEVTDYRGEESLGHFRTDSVRRH